jgi:hypothetical protein
VTPGQRRFGEMIAIRLAVEVLAGPPPAPYRRDSHLIAARHLGATSGTSKHDTLACLVALLRLQPGGHYRPTATVTRALAHR